MPPGCISDVKKFQTELTLGYNNTLSGSLRHIGKSCPKTPHNNITEIEAIT